MDDDDGDETEKYVHTRIYIQKKAYKDKVKSLERKNEKLSRQLRYFLEEVLFFSSLQTNMNILF